MEYKFTSDMHWIKVKRWVWLKLNSPNVLMARSNLSELSVDVSIFWRIVTFVAHLEVKEELTIDGNDLREEVYFPTIESPIKIVDSWWRSPLITWQLLKC